MFSISLVANICVEFEKLKVQSLVQVSLESGQTKNWCFICCQ